MKRLAPYAFIILSSFVYVSCSNSNSIQNEAIQEAYPKLYGVVFNRSYEQIIPFTNHSSAVVRRQAWRSLALTPIDSLSAFIEKVKANPSDVSWFALSMHDVSGRQLRNLEKYWIDTPDQRAGISLVLGQQGDEKTLQFLLDHLKTATGSDYEREFALAVGRLMLDYSVEPDQQLNIIKKAFATDNPKTTLAWLYGFYRGDIGSENKKVRELIYNTWKKYGIGKSARIDQYVTEILGKWYLQK